jgi:predicted membrane protein
MRVETAVTVAAELATRYPTIVEKILLVITVLVLLGMVFRAWNVMLAAQLAPQRGQVKLHGRRCQEKTKPPVRKKK